MSLEHMLVGQHINFFVNLHRRRETGGAADEIVLYQFTPRFRWAWRGGRYALEQAFQAADGDVAWMETVHHGQPH